MTDADFLLGYLNPDYFAGGEVAVDMAAAIGAVEGLARRLSLGEPGFALLWLPAGLFLGVLALWIGVCTFGSQYARNFAAYSFVLSGYTAAIVGIPAALEANNAFYTATARVTEIWNEGRARFAQGFP